MNRIGRHSQTQKRNRFIFDDEPALRRQLRAHEFVALEIYKTNKQTTKKLNKKPSSSSVSPPLVLVVLVFLLLLSFFKIYFVSCSSIT